MRSKCEVCGDYRAVNNEGVCYDCLQDELDLEDWLPEDDDEEEDEV